MRIDDHNHPYYHGHDCKAMLENMDKYGIDKTWLLSWESPITEWDPSSAYCTSTFTQTAAIPFSSVVDYMKQAPDRFIAGYAPDPRDPYAINRLKAAVMIHHVKVCGEVKLRMMYDNPDALRLFRAAGEMGLPVLVHIDYSFGNGQAFPRPDWWYGGGVEAFERVLIACPDTNFIGHAPGFWAHISGDYTLEKGAYPQGKVVPGGKVPEMLRKYPNLYCDMSAGSGCNALSRDPEFALGFLKEFSDRILYGRDYFDNKHQEFLSSLSLSDEELDKIYCKNAMKLINE